MADPTRARRLDTAELRRRRLAWPCPRCGAKAGEECRGRGLTGGPTSAGYRRLHPERTP